MSLPITVRPAVPADAADLSALLNAVITIGGTTALETPWTAAALDAAWISGPKRVSCMVAIDTEGAAAGFQLLTREDHVPAGWGDIGTFARPVPKLRGVGTALFPATRAAAIAAGLVAINATIRADNAGGLAYYAGLGFETWRTAPGVPLRDGTPVDRIWKKLALID